ncbi:hypothetical protein NIIDNTM18_31950 [Mycolicibacterium litorale]|uniref:Uncharacterized protein n=1 Tax=Mycolicibacterium litorale TaxID=758802 RepID=A0A6S6P8U8_9MYCO|nr:hypothetical protein NIIDNTM18_31950 [Mycolicibacterium litorale]
MGDQCTRGVEHHRITHRAFGAAEHRAHLVGVVFGVATDQLGELGALETERRRVEGQPLHRAGLNPPDRARGGRGQFVQTVVAVHHQHTGVARRVDPGHHLGQLAPGAADQSGTGPCRVGQRPEQVEHGRHAELTADHRRVPVGGVEVVGERETDPHLRDAGGHLIGAQVDPHAERLEGVGTAGQ